jgi:predicted AAA+ superfamily ATPase
VRGIDGFVRFLCEAALQSGAFLDLSKMAKKAKIPRQSALRHFEVLEDTLIVRRVENDPELEGADLVKHPRFFLFDLGVRNALCGSFDASADRIGQLFEHMVYNQVMNAATARDIEVEAYNLRTRGGFEIDFVFKIQAQRFTVESKSATLVDESDVKQLKAANRFYRKHVPLLIYRGKVEKKISGIWSVPLAKALKIMGL